MITLTNRLYVAAKNLFTEESGEVNVVAIVVLIGIAIVLAILFKGEITKILKMLLGDINTKAKDAIS